MTTATLPRPDAAARSREPDAPRALLRTAADVPGLLERLGNVAPERVLLEPPPGTATEEDALRLHHGEPKRLCELVDGTLVEKAVGDEEEFVAARLIVRLGVYLDRHRLGLLSGSSGRKRMAGGNVRMPDVSFVGNERLDGGRVTTGPTGRPPHLAVEVLSLSNTPEEMALKRAEYFASGVQVVWEIDPRTRTAEVYAGVASSGHVPAAGSLDGGELLPGFALKLTDLFEVLGPPAADPG